MSGKTINRICACCGESAPSCGQWWNRDTGYGVCPRCFVASLNREGWEESIRLYGKPGIHHSIGNTFAFADGPITCIDLVRLDTGRSQIQNEDLAAMRRRYPQAKYVELESWSKAKEKALCTEPSAITEERFMEMLEVLPPQRWQHGKDCESFELMEHTSGRVTTVCARFGDSFFEWQDIAGQSLASHATHCGQVRTPASERSQGGAS